jgi:hypothetical protein
MGIADCWFPRAVVQSLCFLFDAETMAQTSTARPSGSSPTVSEDWLSSLPDALLHTLMSFLTARQAVQTSVLSRRWAGLWCSMPRLEIDHREFKYEESDRVNNWERCETVESGRFVDFVHGLLMFHRAPLLDTFRFYTTRSYRPQIIDSGSCVASNASL